MSKIAVWIARQRGHIPTSQRASGEGREGIAQRGHSAARRAEAERAEGSVYPMSTFTYENGPKRADVSAVHSTYVANEIGIGKPSLIGIQSFEKTFEIRIPAASLGIEGDCRPSIMQGRVTRIRITSHSRTVFG
jgi:hypothetical protein